MNFFIPSLCSAKTTEKIIAISFDDGPSSENTPKILQILKAHDVEATFFCIGRNLKGNETILHQIINEGHIIGNHSFSHHFFFDMFPVKKMLLDMQQMDDELKDIIGLKPILFRPPYGVTNPNLTKAITKGNYVSVGWSVRSMDTVAKENKKLLDKITNGLKEGAIYLFHDTCNITVEVLPSFLEFAKEQGYRIVRLDKMLDLKVYA